MPKVEGLLDHVILSVPYTETFANIYVRQLLCLALLGHQRHVVRLSKLLKSRLVFSVVFKRRRLSCYMISWHFTIK